jgi:hypothetical protein
MDEMKARSVEAELFHGRPLSGFTPALANLKLEARNKHTKDLKSASPWQEIGALFSGLKDLASISRLGEEVAK